VTGGATATPVSARLLRAFRDSFRYTLIALTPRFVVNVGTAALSTAADIPISFSNSLVRPALLARVAP
jgi:hypothetical protein